MNDADLIRALRADGMTIREIRRKFDYEYSEYLLRRIINYPERTTDRKRGRKPVALEAMEKALGTESLLSSEIARRTGIGRKHIAVYLRRLQRAGRACIIGKIGPAFVWRAIPPEERGKIQ